MVTGDILLQKSQSVYGSLLRNAVLWPWVVCLYRSLSNHSFSAVAFLLGTVGSVLGVMRPEREASLSPFFIAEVKNYMPYGLYRGNFFFYVYVLASL